MATKEFTPAELMAAINAMGAKTLEELAEMATDTRRADAAEKIETRLINGSQTVEVTSTIETLDAKGKVVSEDVTDTITLAESWTDTFFDLTERFVGDFITETTDKPGRGSGKRNVTKVEVVTPRGTSFFRVTRDA